jgi:hypothetical protein
MDSGLLTGTGIIATALSVVFALAAFANSRKRQRARRQGEETVKKLQEPDPHHTKIVPMDVYAPPAADDAAVAPAAPHPAVHRAPHPVQPMNPEPSGPIVPVFKQLVIRGGGKTGSTDTHPAGGPADDPNAYRWE